MRGCWRAQRLIQVSVSAKLGTTAPCRGSCAAGIIGNTGNAGSLAAVGLCAHHADRGSGHSMCGVDQGTKCLPATSVTIVTSNLKSTYSI